MARRASRSPEKVAVCYFCGQIVPEDDPDMSELVKGWSLKGTNTIFAIQERHEIAHTRCLEQHADGSPPA
jgi:hypothetical protein